MNVPVSLIWRIHLYTGKPYTVLLTGSLDEGEEAFRESIGDALDANGRFQDLYEPILCLTEEYAHNDLYKKAALYKSIMQDLLGKRLSIPQLVRLCRVLAYYEKKSGSEKKAEEIIRKVWKKVSKVKDPKAAAHFTRSLINTAIEMRLSGLASDISEYVIMMVRNAHALSVAYFQLAVMAFGNLDIFEAERFFRMSRLHSLELEQQTYKKYFIARIDAFMAHILWIFGDWQDALGKVDALLEETSLETSWKMGLLYLEMAILLWRENIPDCRKAFRTYKSLHGMHYGKQAESVDLTLLQACILLAARKTKKGLSLTDERKLQKASRMLRSIKSSDVTGKDRIMLSVYRSLINNDYSILKAVAGEIVSGKIFSTETDVPVEFLPHFVEAAKTSGVWSKKLESWKEKMIKKGLLYLGVRRGT